VRRLRRPARRAEDGRAPPAGHDLQKTLARIATIPDEEAIAKAAVTNVVAMSSKRVFMAVFLAAGRCERFVSGLCPVSEIAARVASHEATAPR